ncbi:tumor protein D54 isoform X21 [Ictidomys tridecemlineatus]|uniref:tumor protein D54 isoform X11 n=1 Tax=Ictidomys tridecemlineatus TaxID=43179 RepID=UPI001A9E6219|nr:tumor protein D54 isoform X11 [Ictidomys tridecemlineatus]
MNMDSAGQDINLNSPNKGLLSDFMTDVPVDPGVTARTPAVEGLTETEEEELRAELAKLQEDPGNPLTGRTEDICRPVHHGLCHQQEAWRHEELCHLQVV